MALRGILEQWDLAVKAYMAGQYEECLRVYESIEEISARMYYNMACAYIKLQQDSQAIQSLTSAVKKDVHLAIAFYQRGVLYLKSNMLSEAKRDLHSTLALLRGNPVINYKQLGLLYKLHISELLYNTALVELHQGDRVAAEDTLYQALHDADIGQSKYIKQALDMIEKDNTADLKPWHPPIGNVFTPPKDVTNNLEKRKFVPKAKVVSAANASDTEACFDGERRIQELRQSAEIKTPKSPLLAVRNLLQKRRKPPTPKMRLNKSTGDLEALAADYQNIPHHDRLMSVPVNTISAIPNKENAHTPEPSVVKPYIGSLYGNNVSNILSSSCDMLTAVANPSVQITGLSYTENKSEDNIHEANNNNVDPKCNPYSQTDKSEVNDLNDDKNSDVKDTDIESGKDTEDTDVNTKAAEQAQVIRQRPPPPSYPPPPLPPNIVINI